MLKRKLHHYFSDQSGVSGTEFALLVPILLLLMIGVVDYGLFVNEGMKVQNAANAVADYVARTGSDENAQVVAEETYNGDFSAITVTSTFSCQCSDGIAGECPLNCGADDYQRRHVSIDISGTFEPLIPFPGIPNSLELAKTVKMRVD